MEENSCQLYREVGLSEFAIGFDRSINPNRAEAVVVSHPPPSVVIVSFIYTNYKQRNQKLIEIETRTNAILISIF